MYVDCDSIGQCSGGLNVCNKNSIYLNGHTKIILTSQRATFRIATFRMLLDATGVLVD